MPLPLYLAMTAAEIENFSAFPPQIAWMACHFSPYGTGLSNCPDQLPPGSMLILNDRTPVCGHDPQQVAEQLRQLAGMLQCSRVLLDLQRPGFAEAQLIAAAAVQALPCPVAVSPLYAVDLSCPVFLPPLPLLQPPQAYLVPWKDREIWLDLAPAQATFRVTEAGCEKTPLETDERFLHMDDRLCCRYGVEPQENGICFHVRQDTEALAKQLEGTSVTCLVGLYQELGCVWDQNMAH